MQRPNRSTALVVGAATLVAAGVVASTSWGAEPAAPAAPGSRSQRVEGPDRHGTAAATSREFFAPGAGRQVFLVDGGSAADALAAGPAAAAVGAPLLLTSTAGLPAATAEELLRLEPSVVRVVGGEAGVPAAVLAEVADLLPSARIERTGGADRYDTAVRVAGEFFPAATGAVLARGDGFADAASGGAAAAGRAVPLVLTGPDGIPPSVRAWAARQRLRSLVVIGSGTAVGDDAVAELVAAAGTGPEVTRIGGADRYETAALVAREFFPRARTAFLATGEDFPDALAAVPAARSLGAPLLLSRADCTPSAVEGYTAAAEPGLVVLLGGATAVADPLQGSRCD